MSDFGLVGVEIPEMPGFILVNPCQLAWSAEDGLASIHRRGYRSAGFDNARDLRERCPELYKHPALAGHLKQLNHTGLAVLVGLEDGWVDTEGDPVIGVYDSEADTGVLKERHLNDGFGLSCWMLVYSSRPALPYEA